MSVEPVMTPPVEENPYTTPSSPEEPGVHPYRSVSRSAIAALFLSIVSVFAFNAPMLILLPISALILGLMASRKIAQYPEEYVGRIPARIAVIASLAIVVGSSSWHTYIYFTEVPDGYERISWRELQPPANQRKAQFSERADELRGEQVFIKGYVYPNEEQTNLRAFVLVRDKGTCCFGGQPKPTDMIYVVLEGDLRINYSWRLRSLGGIFEIDDSRQSVGKINQIGFFRLTADYLK